MLEPMLPLDLPTTSRSASASPRREVFAGFTAPQLVIGAGVLVLLIWAMWVTRVLTAAPPQHIVKANLSRIVGDYVQAQARSATPPAQVQAQMQQFMSSLDSELQRRSSKGQIVLVGEAVLSKSVPDITGDVVNAIYSAGVVRPRPAALQAPAPGLMPQPASPLPQAPVMAPGLVGTPPAASDSMFTPASGVGGGNVPAN